MEISSIVETLIAAMKCDDYKGAAWAFKNLNKKMAGGDVNKMHSQLLLESHNLHGMIVFGVDPLARMTDVERSGVLLPEVEEYRIAKEEIFKKNYPYIAGNTWAHELSADSMLDNFRRAVFLPYENFYKPKEYQKVVKFFTVHKDESREGGNVEQQHEEMARKTVESACFESLAHIEQVREGGLIFLNHQAKLWDGMLRELEKARHVGKIIKPRESGVDVEEIFESYNGCKQESDSINKYPNTSIKQVTATKPDFQNSKQGARSKI